MKGTEGSESLLRAFYAQRISDSASRPAAAVEKAAARPLSVSGHDTFAAGVSRLDRPTMSCVVAAAALAAMVGLTLIPRGEPTAIGLGKGMAFNGDTGIESADVLKALDVMRESWAGYGSKGESL